MKVRMRLRKIRLPSKQIASLPSYDEIVGRRRTV
jgi:hypothetical protein